MDDVLGLTLMDGFGNFWSGSDGVGRAVALLLLAMSVSGLGADPVEGLGAAARAARHRARGAGVLGRRRAWTMVARGWPRSTASGCCCRCSTPPPRNRWPARWRPRAGSTSQLTRRLRDALHRGLAHLQFGQVLLASIGSTAPFVGLFGTVWGIYHALAGIAAAGNVAIDKVAGPVGEALIMTAAGIAVAMPAVLAYNVFGKWVAACEAELEGFAHDLREMVLDTAAKD